MNTITMLCGLPRSGKSTWIKENNPNNNIIISADNIRYLVYGQRFWNDGESLMWSIREMILKMLLSQGVDIIIDETNTTIKRRKAIIDLAKKFGYTVDCVIISTPLETCMYRAILNGDKAIITTIERMSEQFELPHIEEGFNFIYIV